MTIGQNAVGANFDQATDDAVFELGTIMLGQGGKIYIYLQANGAVTGDGYVVSFQEDFDAAMIDTDTAATITEGRNVAVAECAVSNNQYFWGQIYGPCGIRSEASALADAFLGPTGDAGQVDDAAATGVYIAGMVFNTATGGADAVNTTGYIRWPVVTVRMEPETT
jgi:hypothetical protein